MKTVFVKLGIICIMLVNYLSSVFAQGVLTIEISDTLNAPVVGLDVKVVNEGGDEKIYKTDTNGRVIDSECPVGKYTYSFDYGDYNTGAFEITSGEYTWVNLDYRRVSINFADSKGNPQKGNNVKFYIRDDKDNKVLIAERESNESGRALFIVPKGLYTYQTINDTKNIEVNDENINTTIEVAGALVTHAVYFEFRCEGVPTELNSNNINVLRKENGDYVRFGVAVGSLKDESFSRTPFSKTEGNVSCPAGEYQYSVFINDLNETIKKEFIVKDDDPISELVIPIDVTDFIIVEDGKESRYLNPDKNKPLFNLTLKVTNCEDRTEGIEHVMTRCVYPRRGLTSMSATNEEGIAQFSLNEGTYHIVIPGDTIKNFSLTSDTTVEMCLYKGIGIGQKKHYQELYFGFKKGNQVYYPQDTKEIMVYGGNESIILKPMLDTLDGLYKFSNPVYLLEDSYTCSFTCDEQSYSERIYSNYYMNVDTVWFKLKEFYKMEIRVIHQDSTPVKSSFHGPIKTNYVHRILVTDSTGVSKRSFEKGTYDFSIAGATFNNFKLDRDTLIYIILPDTRDVYFQLLHDGEEIYPSMTNYRIDIYTPGMEGYDPYTVAEADIDKSCKVGNSYCWKFSVPTPLSNGEYILDYAVGSYNYESDHLDSLNATRIHINVPPTDKDTTIYIILPYKYTTTIHLTDANGTDIQGVYGKIFKYDENGELGTDNTFDGAIHKNLKTNSYGIFTDHLLPGRYQLQILDIIRDFEISDYNLNFSILSDIEKHNAKFKILNKETKEPVYGLKLEIKKEGALYSISKSNTNGEINVQCEIGDYTYQLMYGDAEPVAYTILDKDEEITILVDNIVKVEDIKIQATSCIENGNSTTIKTQIIPSDASIKEINLSLNSELLATLTTSGLMTANKYNAQGEVEITAKATDGSNVSKSITVKIGGCDGEEIIPEPEPILVSGIALTTADECVNNGKSTQITATVSPNDATSKEIKFTVNDHTLATISADGKLTANAENKGNVAVTAKATDGSNVTKSIIVKIGGCDGGEIIPEPEPILVSSIALEAVGEICNGESTQIYATVYPSDATNQNLLYSIDNEILATISNTGLLSANSLGKTGEVTITVTATDGSHISAIHKVMIGNCENDKFRFDLDFSAPYWNNYTDYLTMIRDNGKLYVYLDKEHDTDSDYTEVFMTINKYNISKDGVETMENSHMFFDDYIFFISTDKIHWDFVEAAPYGINERNSFVINNQNIPDYDVVYIKAYILDSEHNTTDNFIYGTGKESYNNLHLEEDHFTDIITLKLNKPSVDETVIPTVFTPTEADGANDDFMPGYPVIIYNRVGDVICVSSNGWDGTYKGKLADAGVYIYVVTLKDGSEKRGTIQLYKE